MKTHRLSIHIERKQRKYTKNKKFVSSNTRIYDIQPLTKKS